MKNKVYRGPKCRPETARLSSPWEFYAAGGDGKQRALFPNETWNKFELYIDQEDLGQIPATNNNLEAYNSRLVNERMFSNYLYKSGQPNLPYNIPSLLFSLTQSIPRNAGVWHVIDSFKKEDDNAEITLMEDHRGVVHNIILQRKE